MTLRGFSSIELLFAIAIGTMAIIGCALVIYATPIVLANIREEEDASLLARRAIAFAVFTLQKDFSSVVSTTTTNGIYTTATSISPEEDESIADISSTVSWKDLFGTTQLLSFSRRITDASSTDNACDPFVSGDWTHPVLKYSYEISTKGILPKSVASDTYTLSSLAVRGSTLIAGSGSTASATSPTLFFFSIATTSALSFNGSADNAKTSTLGFSALTTGGGYVYAGNGFSSASSQTCSDSVSCAQVQIFTATSSVPTRIASISLSQTSPPYAQATSGGNATVKSLFYRNGFLFVGLQKKIRGDEFNIVDVHNPFQPRWVSGIAIGRTVNNIFVRGTYAYLSTDDSSRELIVVDMHDMSHPIIDGSWNGPGSSGFGYGAASSARGPSIRFGRTYVSNAPEFSLLNAADPTHISLADSNDSGTTRDPESVRALHTQDFLTFLLLTHRLEFWDTHSTSTLTQFAPPYQLPTGTEGVALACKGSTLYVGRTRTSDGVSFIDVLTGS